jgi:CRISPR-associated protein Cmr2
MNLWERKLLAFLHDPPSKPFNIAEHRQIAAELIKQAGFEDLQLAAAFFDKVCDHTAAAADRVGCPKSSAMHADWQRHEAFKHPLGAGLLSFERVITAAEAEQLVEAEQPQASEFDLTKVAGLRLAENDVRAGPDWARFFLHWRLWPERCAKRAPSLVHLPADTRIPDHTIWTHCSLVSALQACVEVTGEGDKIEWRDFKPAFLLVQIGPVQEFISQARPTRDLWSGSYLLSWLVAHGIKAVTDRIGPDCVLFPALRGQPLFDFLHKKELYGEEALNIWKELGHAPEHILTPNLTNRFLAVVPEGQAAVLAAAAEQSMRDELENSISNVCLEWLRQKGHPIEPGALQRWRQQVRQFLTVHWQVWPWVRDVPKAIQQFKALPLGKEPAEGQTTSPAESLERAYVAAREGIPSNDLDSRNYRHQAWKEGDVWKSKVTPGADGLPQVENPGFAWAAHYAQVEFHLAARRNTRDFERWGLIPEATAAAQKQADQSREGATKDVLSGKEETIGSQQWQEALTDLTGHLFREGDRLAAMNILKRIWHVAYLESKHGLKRRGVAFDSVPAIAAASWRRKLIQLTESAGRIRDLLVDPNGFGPLASAARDFFPADIEDWGSCSDRTWLERSDASIFHVVEWDRAVRDEEQHAVNKGGRREEALKRLRAARAALAKLQGTDGLNSQPIRYVAILAMDGDSMGQWVSGAKSPKWREQLAKEATAYFERQHPEAKRPDALRQLLDAPRHVSPSFHLQFSEALANFSLYLAGPIVQSCDGQLVYSGGDDVLAMLPAERVLDCARALRMAFQGDPALRGVFPGVLPAKDDAWGFVALDGDWEGWSRLQKRTVPRGYQLIVPGKNADVSAGIAIGHMHTPLQSLVEAAREAEKAAKRAKEKGGYGKSAFAVHLYKRSGEVLRWGARWSDDAVKLADFFGQLTDDKKLSAKFPYALAANLRPYAQTPHPTLEAKPKPFRIEPVNGFDPQQVFAREFEHVLRQQSDDKWRSADVNNEASTLRTLAQTYLKDCDHRGLDDFLGPFLTTTFIRKASD